MVDPNLHRIQRFPGTFFVFNFLGSFANFYFGVKENAKSQNAFRNGGGTDTKMSDLWEFRGNIPRDIENRPKMQLSFCIKAVLF